MAATFNRYHPRARRQARRSVDSYSDTDTRLAAAAFPSGLGWMAIAWTDEALEGIVFGHPSRRRAEVALRRAVGSPRDPYRVLDIEHHEDAPPWVRRLVDDLQRFADGEPVEFGDVPITQRHLTPFGRKVVAACRRIGWGQAMSYGELAARCGAPGAARAVGSVMARNRFPLVVPCHRVLGAGGRLGGYSAPGGLRTKRALLENELPHRPTLR